MSAPFGASKGEWFHFADDLGLGLAADLLPVVADPNAEISEHSVLQDLGKIPSLFNRHGKVAGIKDWPAHKATARQIDRWKADDRLGFCIICRRVRAIDIDVPDPERANRIAEFVDDFLGVKLPRRVRANSGKLLMLALVESAEPLSKEVVPVDGGMVEMLGDKQQAVLAGTHSSGARLQWIGGLPAAVPQVAPENYRALIDALITEFATGEPVRAVLRERGEDVEANDPVAAYLFKHSLVLGESHDGNKLFVDCPKRELHTRDRDASQTVWFRAGSGGHSTGHFDCRHESHGKISDAEFLAHIGFVDDVSGDFQELEPLEGAELALPTKAISATPYQWRDPRSVPLRPWLYGRQMLRGALSILVAPGATGKTALLVGTSLALATGRPLLGKDVHERPQRVWLWNLEDGADELARLIQAACIQWEIAAVDMEGRLFVDSGLDGSDLCTATSDRNGFKVLAPVMAAVVAELKSRAIDVLVVDPFVSSHRVPENDNGAIDAIAKSWARVAVEADCAVVLAHHTSKTAGAEVTAEKARGASALINAARSVVALNRMTPEEAGKLGVSDGERRRYFRAYDDKNNRAPPAEVSDWFKLEGVPLGNAADPLEHGDDVQVVVPWTPPRASEGIGVPELIRVQEAIEAGEWRKSEQAQHWAGRAVAGVLGVDLESPGVRQRVRMLLKGWLADGSLREDMRPDSNRILRPCIVVGHRLDHADPVSNVPCSSPAGGCDVADCTTCASVVQISGASAAIPAPHHPPPLGGGGGGAAGEVKHEPEVLE